MSKKVREIKVGEEVFVKTGSYGTYHRNVGFVRGICVHIEEDDVDNIYTVSFDEEDDVRGAWISDEYEGDLFLYVRGANLLPALKEGDRVKCIRPIDDDKDYLVGVYGTVDLPSNVDGVPLIDFDNGESWWAFYASEDDEPEIILVESDADNVADSNDEDSVKFTSGMVVMAVEDVDNCFPTKGLIGKVADDNRDNGYTTVEFMSDKYFEHGGWDNGSGKGNMLYVDDFGLISLPALKEGDRVVGLPSHCNDYDFEGVRGTVLEVDSWDDTVYVLFDEFIPNKVLEKKFGTVVEQSKLLWCDYNNCGDFDVRPLSARELEEEGTQDSDETQPEPILADGFNPTYKIGEKVRFVGEVDDIFETTNCIGEVIEYDPSDLDTDSNYLYIRVTCYDGVERELYCFESDVEKYPREVEVGSTVTVGSGTVEYTVIKVENINGADYATLESPKFNDIRMHRATNLKLVN